MKLFKRFLGIFLVFGASLFLVACGGGSEDEEGDKAKLERFVETLTMEDFVYEFTVEGDTLEAVTGDIILTKYMTFENEAYKFTYKIEEGKEHVNFLKSENKIEVKQILQTQIDVTVKVTIKHSDITNSFSGKVVKELKFVIPALEEETPPELEEEQVEQE